MQTFELVILRFFGTTYFYSLKEKILLVAFEQWIGK